ncbi:MAG: class I SAM-dependent methyltransferase [Proteobacteria bacterium]|nr:class I SAM-dependent methyltransferase [Pseudomonadota bacterium]
MSRTEDFYDRFPFPGPCSAEDAAALRDLANGIQMLLPAARLESARVADVGCGTGQRLINLAQRFPASHFVGIDPGPAAIEQARAAAQAAGVANIDWRVERLETFADSGARFDLVIASGLLHHLDDPKAGVADLARVLAPEGVLYAWLYHAIGEFDRLRQRELARMFCPDFGDVERMADVSDALALTLAADHYGPSSVHVADAERLSHAVIDAYFHPTVAAFRFGDMRGLLEACDLQWYCINCINTPGASYLLNTGDAAGVDCLFAPKMNARLKSDALRRSYASQRIEERLRTIELLFKPTGFTLLAGRHGALAGLTERVRRAACMLQEPA